MNLRSGTLDISAQFTALKVLSPATIIHLFGEQELTSTGYLLAGHPETDKAEERGVKSSLITLWRDPVRMGTRTRQGMPEDRELLMGGRHHLKLQNYILQMQNQLN